MRINKKLGIIAGLLAGTATIPFLANRGEDSPKKPDTLPPAKTKMLGESDFDFIKSLVDDPKDNDFRGQEIKWAEVAYPVIKDRVINLYKAEIEDLKGLKEGKITEKERKVKICLTDFVPPNEQGDDMGVGPKLHVIKYFDDKLPNGKTYRTYVNEHLPVNIQTGVVHPPDVMRVKVQVFGNGVEDLYKPSTKERDTEMLLVSEMFKIAWGKKEGELEPFPYFARQHFFGEFQIGKKENAINQTEEILSVPNSCYFCHEVSRYNAHTKHIFKDPNVKRVNYGAVTQDYMFELPFSKQHGYEKYMNYLNEKVRKGELKREDVERISKDLVTSISYSSLAPLMLKGFEENNQIPWLDGDEKATEKDKELYRFTYEDAGDVWTRKAYSHYRPQLLDLRELVVIPRKK